MMMVQINEETAQPEIREGFTLALPKFLWAVLEGRAKTLHQGDLEITVMELVAEELVGWFMEATTKLNKAPVTSVN